MSINPNSIVVSYAEVFIGSRLNSELQTLTPLASPAPTATGFSVNATDAAMLGGLRHFLALSASVAGLAWTATEAATMPRITSITAAGTAFAVAVSPALPAAPTSATPSVTIPYRCVGATDGGVTINMDTSSQAHGVDQSLDPVLYTQTNRDTTITVPAAEISLDNIAIALGQAPPSAGSNQLEIGGLSQTPREYRLLVIGKGTTLARRLWLFQRVINDGSLGLNNQKDSKQMLNNEFKAFVANVDGRPVLGNIYDAA